jgi:hypothetical protein
MGRFLLTPYKASESATGAAQLYTNAGGGYGEKLTSSGFYIKTGGASRIDPTRLVIFISRNSSKATSEGIVSVVSGSTAGGSDYFPGAYSTLNNLNYTIPSASGYKYGGVSGNAQIVPLFVSDVAKYLDSNDYLKFNVSSELSSIQNSAASVGAKVFAMYIKQPGH